MPKQYVLFRRPMPRLGGRRVSVLLASLALFGLVSLLFTLPSRASLQAADRNFSITKSIRGPWKAMVDFNPFKPPPHPLPRQKNDRYGASSWYATWKWLAIPFSSSLTLDESRALLPVLPTRTPIYCYYDYEQTAAELKGDEKAREAESQLLLAWRRAWWAQGFRPVVLGPAEARNNPLYREVAMKAAKPKDALDETLHDDLMRWLAWESMEAGVLVHHRLFPMGSWDDVLLSFLRRGKFPTLTRWTSLGTDGLLVGSKDSVTAAVKQTISSPGTAHDVLTAVQMAQSSPVTFTLDEDGTPSLALYETSVIQQKYPKLVQDTQAAQSKAAELSSLNRLIQAHLHNTWTSIFKDGIAVLKPLPDHTTAMIASALELAQRLAHCPASPVPSSCPPNRPKCNPCIASHPPRVSTPTRFRNTSTVYTIGVVPHPYTMSVLRTMRSNLDVRWVRRDSGPRDAWVTALTLDILGAGMAGAPRVLHLKEAIAAEPGAYQSLWLTAESDVTSKDLAHYLDWHFGFAVPTISTWQADGRSNSPVPAPDRRPEPLRDAADGPVPAPEDLARESQLLSEARRAVKREASSKAKLLRVFESWFLADAEAWRFVRAHLDRAVMELMAWEKEEAAYAGGMGSNEARPRPGVGWASRWLDRE